MYCYKCGQPMPENAAFCSYCGTAATPVPPPTQAPLPAEKIVYQAQPPKAPAPLQPPVPPLPPAQAIPVPPPPVPSTPAPASLDSALHKGVRVVPKRSKTRVDMVCGVVFLVLGILAIGIYGFAVASLLIEGGLAVMFPVIPSFSEVGFLVSLLSLGYIFALAAGILMVFGGLFALTTGRGRSPSYTAIVLMLFTLAFDAIYLLLMDFWGYLSFSIAETVMRSFFIYAFEVVFVLVPTVLIMLKKRAKKRIPTTLVLQTSKAPPAKDEKSAGAGASLAMPAGADNPAIPENDSPE